MRGDRLRQLRNEKELGQAELANILGISPSAVGMYERDNRDPDDDLKLKIANFFGVSIDYLLGKTDLRDNTVKTFADATQAIEKEHKNKKNNNDSDIDIAFYEGYKDLNEDDKEVMRSTLEAFLKKNKKK